MEINDFEPKLFALTDSELHHKKYQKISSHYNELHSSIMNGKKIFLFDNLIPKDQNFLISKHTRFTPVPMHIHNFIELNYIYSGSCTQVINDKKVVLRKDQICLIDTGIPHSIEYTGEKDILINILIQKDYFLKRFLADNLDGGIVYDFVLNALSEHRSHNQYIIFKNQSNNRMRLTIQQILSETYFPNIGSQKMIEHLIAILFTQLVREFDIETNTIENKNTLKIKKILSKIETEYRTLSLPTLADYFNYTPTYISAFIKKETGKTFSQLILELKLEQANTLITSTNLPIHVCAEECGFSNMTFFYKKYKERFHETPKKNRI